jgi:hypothetical protein
MVFDICHVGLGKYRVSLQIAEPPEPSLTVLDCGVMFQVHRYDLREAQGHMRHSLRAGGPRRFRHSEQEQRACTLKDMFERHRYISRCLTRLR